MAKISNKKLSKELRAQASRLLQQKMKTLSSEENLNTFLNLVFTPTERETILKRFAIVVLLKRNTTYRKIEEDLGVSRTTISKTKQIIRGDGYGKNLEKRTYTPIHKVRKKKSFSAHEKELKIFFEQRF